MSETVHNTFVLKRSYPQSPQKVFLAFSSEDKKRRWYARDGAHEVLSYKLDFAIGGKEVLAGKMKAGTPIAGAVLTWSHEYLSITEGERVVFTQTLDVGAQRISCALITAEFLDDGGGCNLVFTHQAVYFEGADGPQMREMGWKVLLESLPLALD